MRFLLERDAEIYADGFEADYLETAETVGFEPKGPWSGYRSRNLAFFLKEEDACVYEEALRRYQASGPETEGCIKGWTFESFDLFWSTLV